MNHGPLLFFGTFLALTASWFGLVLMPQLQFGRQEAVKIEATGQLYPGNPPGEAAQGAEVYRANGCNYCHSQQPGITGVEFKLVLTAAGTNAAALQRALAELKSDLAGKDLEQIKKSLPQALANAPTVEPIEQGVQTLTNAGASAVREFAYLGPDIDRGWGKRRTVAQDYQSDLPPLLGSLRLGPDLANLGQRPFDASWHYLHLYEPTSVVPGSKMPPYKYLFEERPVRGAPSADALKFPAGFAPPAGKEVVPRLEARRLVAYLLSRRIEAPLLEAPLILPPPPATNAPAATNAPVGTNPPAATNVSDAK